MKAYGLLLLAAIVCALFSDQIDKIFDMDNQLKKYFFQSLKWDRYTKVYLLSKK